MFDAARDAVDGGEISAADLDADRALDAGGQHVDAVADRRHPEVGQARHLDRLIEFFDQLFWRHAGAPLLARLQLDGGFKHLQRCRIGGRLGAAGLAEDALDLGQGLDHPVGDLQQLGRFLCRQPGQRRRHVKQIAFVELGQKFTTQMQQGPGRGSEQRQCDRQRHAGRLQNPFQRRAVAGDQAAGQRVLLLGRDAAANPVTHQDRDQGDRKPGCRGHRIGLGEGQRAEQAPFLCL